MRNDPHEKIAVILREVGGRAVVRKGQENECRILEAFENAHAETPEWFYDINWAKRELDLGEGVDFVVKSDVGQLYLQIKSSDHMRDKFCDRQAKRTPRGRGRYNPYIAVVSLERCLTNEAIYSECIKALSKKREEILAMRAPQFIAICA